MQLKSSSPRDAKWSHHLGSAAPVKRNVSAFPAVPDYRTLLISRGPGGGGAEWESPAGGRVRGRGSLRPGFPGGHV